MREAETTFVCLPSVGRGEKDLHALAAKLGGHAICPAPIARDVKTAKFEDIAADAVSAAGDSGDVVFVGHAYGGHVALAAGALLGERTRGVVAIGIGAKSYPDELGRLIDRAANPELGDDVRREALAHGFFHGTVHDSWLDGWNRDLMAYQRAARRHIRDPNLLHGGKAPVLDLIGAEDPFRPRASYTDLSTALGARVQVEVLASARHALTDEYPVEIARAVHRWLQSLCTPATPEQLAEAGG